MAVKSKKEFQPNDRKRLAGSLQGVHLLVAGFTKTPEFMLSDDESGVLTNALADVLDKHEINVTGGMSVEVTLLMAIIMIEKPKLDALRQNALSRKAKVPEPAPVLGGGDTSSSFY